MPAPQDQDARVHKAASGHSNPLPESILPRTCSIGTEQKSACLHKHALAAGIDRHSNRTGNQSCSCKSQHCQLLVMSLFNTQQPAAVAPKQMYDNVSGAHRCYVLQAKSKSVPCDVFLHPAVKASSLGHMVMTILRTTVQHLACSSNACGYQRPKPPKSIESIIALKASDSPQL